MPDQQKRKTNSALSLLGMAIGALVLAVAGYVGWVLTVQAISEQVSMRVSRELAESTKAIQQAQAQAIQKAIEKQAAEQQSRDLLLNAADPNSIELPEEMSGSDNPLQNMILQRLMNRSQNSPDSN